MFGLVGFLQLFFLLFFAPIWFPLVYSQCTFWTSWFFFFINILLFINKKEIFNWPGSKNRVIGGSFVFFLFIPCSVVF